MEAVILLLSTSLPRIAGRIAGDQGAAITAPEAAIVRVAVNPERGASVNQVIKVGSEPGAHRVSAEPLGNAPKAREVVRHNDCRPVKWLGQRVFQEGPGRIETRQHFARSRGIDVTQERAKRTAHPTLDEAIVGEGARIFVAVNRN